MDPWWTKVLCSSLIVALSSVFGFIPLIFQKKILRLSPSHTNYSKKNRGNVILSFLLNFGGGILIANCFCHWLPEVRESIEHKELDTSMPLAEIIMCAGFFGICVIEELLHHFLHPHQEGQKRQEKEVELDETSFTDPINEKPVEKEDDVTGRAAMTKSALRTFFVVSALSFHSVVEGLALGIEQSNSGVWMNFGAAAMHKFVIAFAVGVELVAAQSTKLNYFVSILTFSFAPALGVGVAFIMQHSQGAEFDDFVLQILQGLATGTVVYVVFFEILPKGTQIGGTGFQHVLAMTIGFAIFIPSLLFHSHEHGEGDTSTNDTSTDHDH